MWAIQSAFLLFIVPGYPFPFLLYVTFLFLHDRFNWPAPLFSKTPVGTKIWYWGMRTNSQNYWHNEATSPSVDFILRQIIQINIPYLIHVISNFITVHSSTPKSFDKSQLFRLQTKFFKFLNNNTRAFYHAHPIFLDRITVKYSLIMDCKISIIS